MPLDILDPGQKLAGGVGMASDDGHYELVMQGDGNLVELRAVRVQVAAPDRDGGLQS